MIFSTGTNETICANCKHYNQHYGLMQGKYFALNCGNCGYPRNKSRKPYETCKNFERK